MPASKSMPDWLQGYGSNLYDWHTTTKNGRRLHWRRIGMVEGLFDLDGTDFEGRADLNMNLHIEIRTSLHVEKFYARILKAWSIFRQQHVLLSALAVKVDDIDSTLPQSQDRAFLVQPSPDPKSLFEQGNNHLVFVDDYYPNVSAEEFYDHLTNTSRAIDASSALSRLHVLPFAHSTQTPFTVHFMLIAGHQIVDGLTTFRWMNSFIDILNLPDSKLNTLAKELTSTSPISRLPPAQETLYPPIHGPLARQRWFWAITRILRHTKKPAPPPFPNPLYRSHPLPRAIPFPPKYPHILSYTPTPPLNSYHVNATLSPSSTSRLRHLCHEARISVGSGLFALVAITMMTLHEERHPDIAPERRKCFLGSFPVNPRPFLTGNPAPDSLMLAFSEGLRLPFLPSDLPFAGRFRLLGKMAHRQLKIYQKPKTPRTLEEEAALGTKSGAQLMPLLYATTADRLEMVRKPEAKMGWDVQGGYPVRVPMTRSTCGISSVGDRSALIRRGRYDVGKELEEGKDLVVDFRDLGSTVRARDGEFLVGAAGEKEWIGLGVSYDGCMVDPERARAWKGLVEGVLEDGGVGGREMGEEQRKEERARL